MIIYGIKNCDTMQKAFKYLDVKNIKYKFHNYKTEGIDKETIKRWFKYLPMEEIINSKSRTFKNLTTQEKADTSNSSKAVALLIKNTSMIKRPLLDLGEGKFLIGFNIEEWSILK